MTRSGVRRSGRPVPGSLTLRLSSLKGLLRQSLEFPIIGTTLQSLKGEGSSPSLPYFRVP